MGPSYAIVIIVSYTVSGITWTRIGVEGGGLVLVVEDGELLMVMIRLEDPQETP